MKVTKDTVIGDILDAAGEAAAPIEKYVNEAVWIVCMTHR